MVPTGAAHARSIPPTRHISDHDHTENSLEFMDERRNFKNASTSLRLKPAKVAVPFSKGKEGMFSWAYADDGCPPGLPRLRNTFKTNSC